MGKALLQRGFQQGGDPVVGQAAGGAGHAAADVGAGQFDQAVTDDERTCRGHARLLHGRRVHAQFGTGGVQHADDLHRQGVVGAGFGGGFGAAGLQDGQVGHRVVAHRQADGHFGAADVDTCFHGCLAK
jgi:hypothetical protein